MGGTSLLVFMLMRAFPRARHRLDRVNDLTTFITILAAADRPSMLAISAHGTPDPDRCRAIAAASPLNQAARDSTIPRTMSIARRIRIMEASRVRNPACDVRVTF